LSVVMLAEVTLMNLGRYKILTSNMSLKRLYMYSTINVARWFEHKLSEHNSMNIHFSCIVFLIS
jgi:hypothetical protein